jgi:hypothetical protein
LKTPTQSNRSNNKQPASRAQLGTPVAHGKESQVIGYREDRKLKIDAVKASFQKMLVEAEWTCKKGEFKAKEVENLTGEVSILILIIDR